MAFYPNAGALLLAAVVQAELAACEIRLFKFGDITPDQATTLAELDAAECDFTGYAAEVVAAWQDPALNALGGAGIQTSVQFNTASPYTTSNVVGGYYIVDLTGTPEVLAVQAFAAPGIEMGFAGQAIPITQLLLFGSPNA